MTEGRVLASGLEFPEGPVALPDGSVLVAEIRGGRIRRIAPDGTAEVLAETGGGPNGCALGPDGGCYVANSGGWDYADLNGIPVPLPRIGPGYEGGRIERVDLQSGEVRRLYDDCAGRPLVSPNDLVFDSSGGFWFTDHGRVRDRERLLGGVFYAAPDGSSIREVLAGLDSPNGIGLSPDESVLYVADTSTGRVHAWELAGEGQLGAAPPVFGHGGRLVADPGRGVHFDSLAVEASGNVVVAAPGAGSLFVFAPSGELVEEVPVEDLLVTNVTFGGPDLRTAFVTLSGRGELVALDWPRPGLRVGF